MSPYVLLEDDINIIILALLESVGLPYSLDPNNSTKISALQLSAPNPSARQFHISTPGWGPGNVPSRLAVAEDTSQSVLLMDEFFDDDFCQMLSFSSCPAEGHVSSTLKLESHRTCSFIYQMDQADVRNHV